MLNRRMVAALLGGGAGLVCNAGLAVGQIAVPHDTPLNPPTGIVGDPTPNNVANCVGHIIPTNALAFFGTTHECGSAVTCPLTPLVGAASWEESNPIWVKDRRPLIMIQMGSETWRANSRANPVWWYADFSSMGTNDVQPEDLSRDVHTAQEGNFESSADWVTTGDGPNGVPDQFESLIRPNQTWRTLWIPPVHNAPSRRCNVGTSNRL